jgi:hypothetical protein
VLIDKSFLADETFWPIDFYLDLIWIVKSYGGLLDFSACDLISATQANFDGGFRLKTFT